MVARRRPTMIGPGRQCYLAGPITRRKLLSLGLELEGLCPPVTVLIVVAGSFFVELNDV